MQNLEARHVRASFDDLARMEARRFNESFE